MRESIAGTAHLALVGLLVAGLAWFELSSVDIGYHVAYGRWMLQHHRVLEVDPFIYGASDYHFINVNWLTQVFMAWLCDHFDWMGLTALRLGLVAATFTCVAGAMRAAGAGAHAIAIAWLVGAVGAYERFSMRPELFSYAILSAQIWLLMRGPRRRATMVGVPMLQAFWGNLHSYYLLGLLTTICFAVGSLFRGDSSTEKEVESPPTGGKARRTVVTPPKRPGGMKAWGLLIVLQTSAFLCNPWLQRGALFPLQTLGELHGKQIMAQAPGERVRSPWGIISEFQSPFGFFDFLGASRTTEAYPVLLGIAACGMIAALVRRQWGWALAILLMGLVSTQMRRNIPFLALAGVPLAIGALARPLQRASSADRRVRALKLLAILVNSGLTIYWMAGLWSGQFYFVERRPVQRLAAGWAEEIFPFEAIKWINEHSDLKPQLFTDLMTSSNVLPWLRPERQVFITTNTFAYPAERLRRCWDVGTGTEAYRGLFDEYGVNMVLLRAHGPTGTLIRALADEKGWALVYFDRTYVIFVRRISEHAGIIAANERKPSDLNPDQWIADAPKRHASTGYRLGTIASVPFCLGWFERAQPLFEAAVHDEPTFFEAWENLGICHAAAGRAEYAREHMENALGEYRAAVNCFESDVHLDPPDAQSRIKGWNSLGRAHGQCGDVLQNLKRPDEAVREYRASMACFEKVLKLDERNQEAHSNRELIVNMLRHGT